MTPNERDYVDYLQVEISRFESRDAAGRAVLKDAVNGAPPARVLDIGCGAGQEMLPFAESAPDAQCVGLDTSPHSGKVGREFFRRAGHPDRAAFVIGTGEHLPFGDESFDVLICRLVLPYMDNRESIAEMARVLRPGGHLFLRIHAPLFYLWMLKKRAATLSPKQWAYPLICMAGGAWFWATGRQPRTGVWKGKEVFQTEGKLRKLLAGTDLSIDRRMPDSTSQTPSFLIVKG